MLSQIPECEEEDLHEERYKNKATPSSNGGSSATPSRHHKHTLTPLHHNGKPKNKKRHEDNNDEDGGGSVSCNNCRPHHSHRDKFSVVPLESHNNNPSFIYLSAPRAISSPLSVFRPFSNLPFSFSLSISNHIT